MMSAGKINFILFIFNYFSIYQLYNVNFLDVSFEKYFLLKKVNAGKFISASPDLVLSVFHKQVHLSKWWGVDRSFIQMRPGGIYLLTWQTSENGFGYVTTGTVSHYEKGKYLSIQNMSYLNPKYPILAPMQIAIKAHPQDDGTLLSVEQSGYLEGPDWDWYFAATQTAWPRAVDSIKKYLEQSKSD